MVPLTERKESVKRAIELLNAGLEESSTRGAKVIDRACKLAMLELVWNINSEFLQELEFKERMK